MKLSLVNDFGAPLAVSIVDIGLDTIKPEWSEAAEYVMAAGGYIAAGMDFGGEFSKNVGIGAFPLAAKALYNRVKTMVGTGKASQLALRKRQMQAGDGMSRYPAQPFVPGFNAHLG